MFALLLLTAPLCVAGPVPASPLAVSPVVSPLLVQDEGAPEVPDERPEIKELLTKLKGHVKERGKEDDDAISTIDTLFGEFAKSGPKDRVDIVKGLEACFKAKRQELEKDVPDNRLYIACAVCMGSMGPESVKGLIGLIGNKTHRKDVLLQEKLILSLGKTADPTGVKPLLELLKHHDARIQAAGAEALGYHSILPQKERKDVFEELLKTLMTVKSKKDADPMDIEARERYDTTAGPLITSLKLLTGVDESVPEAWQRWWNKNKRNDWDEGKEEGEG